MGARSSLAPVESVRSTTHSDQAVPLDSSVQSVISLGLLVVIRTFLSWSLILEVEGRWPWQREVSEQRVDEMVDDG